MSQTKNEELKSRCNKLIMLITCDATAEYSHLVNGYNWPQREVGICVSIFIADQYDA